MYGSITATLLLRCSFACVCDVASALHVFPSSVYRPEQQVKVPPVGLIDFHQITGGLGGSVTTWAAEVDRGSEDPKGGLRNSN